MPLRDCYTGGWIMPGFLSTAQIDPACPVFVNQSKVVIRPLVVGFLNLDRFKASLVSFR